VVRPILEVENLKKHFPLKPSLLDSIRGAPTRFVRAVDGISFSIQPQGILALVGESGCGKTTTGKLVMGLYPPTEGKMVLDGVDVTALREDEMKAYRREVQMIYQDPFSSINPRFRIYEVLEEPLVIHNIGDREERMEKVSKALEEVKITPPEDYLGRHPHMLSGGQRQRVAIARAMILNPKFVVADEPVSMLDVSIRAEILELMKQLQEQRKLTYLYITHDISTARYFADHIAVMYLGKIVEMGPVREVIDNPIHPYTKALLAAVPEPIPERKDIIKELPIKGEVPSAVNIPPGCRFHPRCPRMIEACKTYDEKPFSASSEHWYTCINP